MSRAAHKITRVVFEIGLHGREHVTTIQNRISAFAGGPLETVFIQSLSALAGEDHLLALAGIELNIGNVSYQRLEEDLAAGIARCLREWALRLPLHRLPMEPARGLKESGGSSGENVRCLPGPAASRISFSSASRGGLNAAIAAALQGPGDWPQLMAAVRDNHTFRCRLANEVSPELLRDLLQALVPINGSMIAEISGVLASLHHCVSSAPVDSDAFRRLLWECILNEAARHHPTRFSVRSFVADVLTQLSARYSLERSVLSSRIRESLRQRGQAAPAITLPTISPGLRQALFDWVEAEPVAQDAGTARSSQPIDQLARFLEWGALPGFAVSGSRHDIDSDMLKSMAASPEAVCSLVRSLGEMQPVRKRISGQLSEETVRRLLGALDPANAPWIFLCQQSLRRLHAQKPLVPLQNRIFAQLLQELALEYLAERHWHALDAGSFMRFLLRGLAARQKTEYELLLAEVALRRSPKSRDTGAQSLVNSAIVTLLEEDLLGVRGPLLATPRFVVRPAFQHLYCDLDVLAYWLRWRKLPAWGFAATPEEMAGRIGPLLRDLPPAVRANAINPQDKAATVSAGAADASAPAVQIEHWLLYGIWPASISLPQNTTLAEWLESQSDSDWLGALRRCGAQDCAVQRVVNHLSPVFLVRIASLLAGPDAQVACGLLRGLSDLKRHIGATISQQWEKQVRRYTLICILRHASSDSQELSCIEELAQTILRALSLNCQVPYERLLLLLRQESQGKEAQMDLCRKLQAKLDHLEANVDVIDEPLACALADGPDLVLHYLKHGSLPENASGLSFHALQQLASRLTEDQMATVAHAAVPWFAGDREIARRTAVLFSLPAFGRLAALLLPGIRFAEEIESLLSVLASRLSLQPAALLIAVRTFFLQHAACHTANFNKELLISGMLERLAEYTGEPQFVLVEQLLHATGGKGVFADAFASLPRELRFIRAELRDSVIVEATAQRANQPANYSNALQQMERLLHSESLSAPSSLAQLMDALASLPRELRFMPAELHDSVIVEATAQRANQPAIHSNALQKMERLLHSGSLPAPSSLAQLMEEFSEGLIQNPHEYSSVLRAAASRASERRRMARVFSNSLFRCVCRLLLSDSDFADKLEYALRALAPHLHADSGLLVAAGREELLQYAATNKSKTPAESMEREILKSLSASLEKQTGTESMKWLRHVAWVLGINILFPQVAGAEKERMRLVLEETESKVSTLPRDTIAELAATEQSKDGVQDQKQAELQVLGHFLRTGDMPWWGHPLLSLSSGRFQSLLKNQPEPVLQMLRVSARVPQAIDFMMRYLPRPDIAAIILKSVPGYSGILILYIAAGAELAEDRSLSKVQGPRVPGIHWRETLLFVLDGEPSKSLPKDALRTLCARVAQKLDLEISYYLEKLSHIASRHAAAERGYAALAEMLLHMQTSAANIKENESTGEKESGYSREPDANAQRRGSGAPDLREATGPITCEKEGSLPASRCDNIEKNELAEGLTFPDETVLTGQLEHLLRYGVLPQTIPEKSLPQFMDDLAQAFIAYPEKFRKQMRKAAGGSLERKRIAWLFSPQVLRHLWPQLLPSGHEQAVFCLEALSSAAISCSGGGVNESLQMPCVEELLHVAGRAEKSRWEIAAFLRRAIRRLQQDHSLRPVEVVERLRKEFAGHTSGIREKLCRVLDRIEREIAVAHIKPPGKPAWAVPESPRIPRVQKTPAPLPAGEPFYVGNAGAILLWPFLGRYFQMLALLEKNSFRGEEEQSRAIHMVQYLATGKLEAPENELLLNKLLCGARPEQPLHPVTAVTAAEEDISQQLLNSVIQTWEKIRNTSIDGLRQSFLVREGQLLRRDSDDSWLLTVSARGYDMLLDSLPWRLSLVRQPWMQTALHVKWR
ncbi:MAG TPA: contractile injection system tape measure protein [Candidatus Angelobacter sp.]|jgi:hypothetical protein